MSHETRSRLGDHPAAQWAAWYLPELSGAADTLALSVALLPAAAVLAAVPLAAIGVQETCRAAGAVRYARRQRNRDRAATAERGQ